MNESNLPGTVPNYFKTAPFPHQLEEWELSRDAPTRALLWEQGCVSADTEVLTPRGWVPVSEVNRHAKVAAYDAGTGRVSLSPLQAYRVFDAPVGIRVYKKGVTDQILSVTHRCPHLGDSPAGTLPVVLAQDLTGSHRLPLSFFGGIGSGERVSLWTVRFRVIHALLSAPFSLGKGTLAVVRPSTRAIWADSSLLGRIQEVFQKARIPTDVSRVEGTSGEPDKFLVTYPAPTSDSFRYNYSDQQLKAVADQIVQLFPATGGVKNRWIVPVPKKSDAEFFQYAIASTGRTVVLTATGKNHILTVRPDTPKNRGISGQEVSPVEIPGGKVYALTVPTGFLLYRRNGFIFPSGNCGKSKPTVDTANYLYRQGKIDAVIVLAPNGVHRNWIEGEVPDHTPDDIMGEVFGVAFSSEKAGTKKHQRLIEAAVKHRGLSWLAMAYESFTTKNGKAAISDFLQYRKVLYVSDEAHRIKSHDSPRVKSILASAKYAPYRRLLTGTPVAVGPFDLYSQMLFLDPKFWKRHGLSTFVEFKRYFAEFTKGWNPNAVRWERDPTTGRSVQKFGAEYPILKNYRRLDELQALLKSHSSRKTKAEVLPDLPPKNYRRVAFQLTPEQRRMYDELSSEFQTWVRGLDIMSVPAGLSYQTDRFCGTCQGSGEIEEDGYIYPCPVCGHGAAPSVVSEGVAIYAELAIVRIAMLQMITSGFVPTKDEPEPVAVIPGPNPRLDALREVLAGIDHPVIVWARYRREIDLICDALKADGIPFGRYDGQVGEAERAEVKARFQGFRAMYDSDGALVGREPVPDSERLKVFVGNPAAGSTGLTLTVARTVVYYSNSFKLIDRLQSEDRAHRIGQKFPVDYIDLEAEGTVDRLIVENLRAKFNIAAAITGDNLMEWIS